MKIEINYPNSDAHIAVEADDFEELVDLLNVALQTTWGKSARTVEL